MAQHQRHIEIFRIAVGTLCAAYVGCGYHHIGQLQALYVRNKHRRSVQVVNRHIEEALNLVGMKIHGYHTVNTCRHEHVGHEFCGDRHAGFVLAVLTGPAEIRHNGYHRLSRRALGGVNHQEQLHQIVAVRECGLYQVDFAATDRLFEAYFEFAVGKVLNFHRAKFYTKFFADFLGHVPRLGA